MYLITEMPRGQTCRRLGLADLPYNDDFDDDDAGDDDDGYVDDDYDGSENQETSPASPSHYYLITTLPCPEAGVAGGWGL